MQWTHLVQHGWERKGRYDNKWALLGKDWCLYCTYPQCNSKPLRWQLLRLVEHTAQCHMTRCDSQRWYHCHFHQRLRIFYSFHVTRSSWTVRWLQHYNFVYTMVGGEDIPCLINTRLQCWWWPYLIPNNRRSQIFPSPVAIVNKFISDENLYTYR